MKALSDIEIAAKIRNGKRFAVGSVRERKRVYDAAKFAGVKIKTEQIGDTFSVLFCKD